jgi:GxxExxY protein
MDFQPLSQSEELIGKAIVNAAYKVHHALGPGLLERVYEVCLKHELQKNGHEVKLQTDIPINYDGITFMEGLRLDMLVDDLVIIELKAVDLMNPVYEAQIISYLKMTRLRLGYLINFNVSLIRDGIQRFRM